MGFDNKLNAPCYKCPNTKLGCHSSCELYKSYIQKNFEENMAGKKNFVHKSNTKYKTTSYK